MAFDPGAAVSQGGTEFERIGGYRVESRLGRGGMGEVYLAYDERLHRRVAIKRIRADGRADDALLRARFRREAQAAARLSHPALVQIYDILESVEGDCIVMEYVEGVNLAERLERGPVELGLALSLAAEIADGLGEAHGKGLVHRDLKAANVLVTPTGHAKILDFGLARRLWGDNDESSLTRAGELVGTIHAMSPEQASGRPVDHRSDLFTFGALLYELLTRRSPFRGANLIDTLRRVVSETPAPLARLRPDLPPALVALVERLLDKDPARRPENAPLVGLELRRIAAEPWPASQALAQVRASGTEDPPPDVAGPALGDLSTTPGLRRGSEGDGGGTRAEDASGWRPAVGRPIPRRTHWRLVERLGQGGFGEAWLGEHHVTGERRVFKFCFEVERRRALEREVTLFRLLKEALGGRDDIARILDWDFEAAPYFLESEYSEGGTLVDWAERAGGLVAVPLALRLELGAEVAEALAAAHSVGVLHKDVKPANVLVTVDRAGRPRIRLSDFGIGLLTDRERLRAEGITALGFTAPAGGADLPSAEAGAGTLRYMAPELMAGKPPTIQADIYSLGVLIYQLVAGDFDRL
ncbi:MAG TPA: protein kinase [Polyangia bacterium]|jgi:serine/threonine-protein kinase|nr:protein kinase [Polyangia bacterium]